MDSQCLIYRRQILYRLKMLPKLSLPTDRTKTWLATANIVVVANAFIWYSLAFGIITENTPTADKLLIYGINVFAIIISGVLGTLLVDKFRKRRTFLNIWIIIGILVSILPLAINLTNLIGLIAISIVFGLYFGLGMPVTMGFHSSLISSSERGKMGGLTFLLIGLITAAIGLALPKDLIVGCLGLAVIRVVGLLFFHYMPKKDLPISNEKSSGRYKAIVTNKPFLLYLIPWLMFTLINYLAATMISHSYTDLYKTLNAFENIPIAITAIISGFIADRWGRKRLTIIGFVILGIGYAILGFSNQGSQSIANQTPIGFIIYIITDGIAFGIFSVLFLFTVWGEFSHSGYSDKFYLLGAIPYVSSYFLRVLFDSSLPKTIPITLISSFATVFLFIAVLPLIYAPETMPEKLMKDRELKSYIEKAKRIAQKEDGEENQKQSKQLKVEQNDSEVPTQESSEEYKKEKELAEKYY
jgi:MFS family permease